ncbi:hypothetical protein EV127DRAFT_454582 [Xylaria flabelliformis]|nr:hypothetical protein EV127DRAFT_454582 [Xylaria flabelliformis]
MMEYQAPTPSFQPTSTAPPPVLETAALPPQPPPSFQTPPFQLQLEQQQQPQQQQQQPQQPQQQFEPPPAVASPFVGTDLRTIKSACEISLRDYASLQIQGGASPGRDRLRAQGALAVSDLRALRSEVAALLRRAENSRWRKWFFGGIIATIIPFVRKIFRRSSHDDHRVSSNDTEHAFRKSKSLIARILDSVHVNGKSGLASIAFFVLAVLYVFQSEVSLRVARTVSKRLKKLVSKVENGVEDVDEQDFKVLNGWRWRVLLW